MAQTMAMLLCLLVLAWHSDGAITDFVYEAAQGPMHYGERVWTLSQSFDFVHYVYPDNRAPIIDFRTEFGSAIYHTAVRSLGYWQQQWRESGYDRSYGGHSFWLPDVSCGILSDDGIRIPWALYKYKMSPGNLCMFLYLLSVNVVAAFYFTRCIGHYSVPSREVHKTYGLTLKGFMKGDYHGLSLIEAAVRLAIRSDGSEMLKGELCDAERRGGECLCQRYCPYLHRNLQVRNRFQRDLWESVRGLYYVQMRDFLCDINMVAMAAKSSDLELLDLWGLSLECHRAVLKRRRRE